jgi:hypothetical protein
MPSDDAPAELPPAELLQFDHADFTAAAAPPALACAACQRPIPDVYYEINGKTLCGACSERISAHFTGGSRLARFLRALLLGGLAAVAGWLMYLLVLVLTGNGYALVLIVMGFLVGAGVRKGARYRGGPLYQSLAVFLTYSAIVFSSLSIALIHAVRTEAVDRPAAGAGATENPPGPGHRRDADRKVEVHRKDEPAGPAAAKPAAGTGLGAARLTFAAALAFMVAYAYAAPFLGGVNVIYLFIIFFALLQAWRMNKRVPLAINGPFQVGGAPPPPQEFPAHA